jgi:hypothetical protein
MTGKAPTSTQERAGHKRPPNTVWTIPYPNCQSLPAVCLAGPMSGYMSTLRPWDLHGLIFEEMVRFEGVLYPNFISA